MSVTTLRQYVRNLLWENFVSHSDEPEKGDRVINNNPGCKHYGSEGVVLDIQTLPDEAGKVIAYQVTNDGPAFHPGDVLEKTLDQLTIDRLQPQEVFLSEGIEFHELDSPLDYHRAGNVKRIAYCDTSVTEPTEQRDAYFKEFQEWENYGASGRRLKKPRKGKIIPGVSNVCIIGFLDYHKQSTTSDGNDMWYIDYMKTRGDSAGQGVASKLVDNFYETIAKPGDHVHFGKMMRKEIGHLKDKMVKQYPDIHTIGAVNF